MHQNHNIFYDFYYFYVAQLENAVKRHLHITAQFGFASKNEPSQFLLLCSDVNRIQMWTLRPRRVRVNRS